MVTPSWLADLFAATMLTTSLYCLARIVASRLGHGRIEHDVDLIHALMGLAMAGMLVNRLNVFNPRIWEAVFTLATAWFAVRCLLPAEHAAARRDVLAHHVPHLLGSGAMLYMYLGMPDVGTISANGGSTSMLGVNMGVVGVGAGAIRYPVIALALSLVLFGYVFQSARAMVPVPATADGTVATPSGQRILAPRAVACCQFAMSTVMAYTLLMMLK